MVENYVLFKKNIKELTVNNFINTWHEKINNSEKCLNYRIFKNKFGFEEYLIRLPFNLRIGFTRFRMSNHALPIEKGRHENLSRNERLCDICNTIGGEYHYIFQCELFINERKQYITKFYYVQPNTVKYCQLSAGKNYSKLCKLAKFIKTIINRVK